MPSFVYADCHKLALIAEWLLVNVNTLNVITLNVIMLSTSRETLPKMKM
jgi:hypothetical protein